MIIAQRGAGSAEAFAAFAPFVENWALPVSQYWANTPTLALSHPMHIGQDPTDALAKADVVLVIDSLAPWWPDKVQLRPDVTVIQLGADPLFSRTPIRNFPAHVTLVGETGPSLLALIDAMSALRRDAASVDMRRKSIAAESAATRAALVATAERGKGGPMTKAWVAHCLGQAIKEQAGKGAKGHGVSRVGMPARPSRCRGSQELFSGTAFGWIGLGLSRGPRRQIADPDRLVFATMGDGSYMFANPTACHQIAEAHALPVIVMVLNNGEWGAVRQSVLGLYPTGEAKQANSVPLTSLRPSPPDFTRTAEASRAWTATVTQGQDLPSVLEEAIAVATNERRQVLLNIAISPDN